MFHGRTCRPEGVPEYVLTLGNLLPTLEINCTRRSKMGKLGGFFGKVGSKIKSNIQKTKFENRPTMNCSQDRCHTDAMVEMFQEGPWRLI